RSVTYLATAVADGDPALEKRIDQHRARRPDTWSTIEVGRDRGEALRQTRGPLLFDAIGPWVAGLMPAEPDTSALLDALRSRDGDTVVVSEEVGLAVHPPTEIARRFGDTIASLNQEIAAISDEVRLVIAGRTLLLPSEPPAIGDR